MSPILLDPWKGGTQTKGAAYLDAPAHGEPLQVMAATKAPAETAIFIDGIQRREANGFITGPSGVPVPVSFQALAAGAAVTAPQSPATAFKAQTNRRFLITSEPHPDIHIPAGLTTLHYQAVQTPDPSAATLKLAVGELRSSLERKTAQEALTAYPGALLVMDGQLPESLSSNPRVIGWIKSTSRFPGALNWLPTLAALTRGQFTSTFPPLFSGIGHEWFVAVRDPLPDEHETAHLIRVQAGEITLEELAALQAWSSHWAPEYASAAYASARAPQQPRPVQALERELGRYLGKAQLVQRALTRYNRSGQLPGMNLRIDTPTDTGHSHSIQP